MKIPQVFRGQWEGNVDQAGYSKPYRGNIILIDDGGDSVYENRPKNTGKITLISITSPNVIVVNEYTDATNEQDRNWTITLQLNTDGRLYCMWKGRNNGKTADALMTAVGT